jgi:hypothetical protein
MKAGSVSGMPAAAVMQERLVSCCLIEHGRSVNARRVPAAAVAMLAERARALYVGSVRQAGVQA